MILHILFHFFGGLGDNLISCAYSGDRLTAEPTLTALHCYCNLTARPVVSCTTAVQFSNIQLGLHYTAILLMNVDRNFARFVSSLLLANKARSQQLLAVFEVFNTL